MANDLFGIEGRVSRKPAFVQPYQKSRTVTKAKWTHCTHDPPCPNNAWCASGTRDVRDLQKKIGCSVDEAIRRVKLGERA